MRKILSFFLILFFSFFLFGTSLAQENKCDNPQSLGLDEIQKCIDELSRAKESSVTATRNLEKQQLKLNKAVRDYYIKSYYNSPLALFLSSDSAEDITQILTYQKKVADQDKMIITNIALILVD